MGGVLSTVGMRAPSHLLLLVFGQMNPVASGEIPLERNLLRTGFTSASLPASFVVPPSSWSLRPAPRQVLLILSAQWLFNLSPGCHLGLPHQPL